MLKLYYLLYILVKKVAENFSFIGWIPFLNLFIMKLLALSVLHILVQTLRIYDYFLGKIGVELYWCLCPDSAC